MGAGQSLAPGTSSHVPLSGNDAWGGEQGRQRDVFPRSTAGCALLCLAEFRNEHCVSRSRNRSSGFGPVDLRSCGGGAGIHFSQHVAVSCRQSPQCVTVDYICRRRAADNRARLSVTWSTGMYYERGISWDVPDGATREEISSAEELFRCSILAILFMCH